MGRATSLRQPPSMEGEEAGDLYRAHDLTPLLAYRSQCLNYG
jgi:hypothetical protein